MILMVCATAKLLRPVKEEKVREEKTNSTGRHCMKEIIVYNNYIHIK